jgi:hypothetical protein
VLHLYRVIQKKPAPHLDNGVGAGFQIRSRPTKELEPASRLAMNDDPSRSAAAAPPARKLLTPAAERALAEAEARRQAAAANAKPAPNEYNGPKGPEPTRYGDWENKGIASDF